MRRKGEGGDDGGGGRTYRGGRSSRSPGVGMSATDERNVVLCASGDFASANTYCPFGDMRGVSGIATVAAVKFLVEVGVEVESGRWRRELVVGAEWGRSCQSASSVSARGEYEAGERGVIF